MQGDSELNSKPESEYAVLDFSEGAASQFPRNVQKIANWTFLNPHIKSFLSDKTFFKAEKKVQCWLEHDGLVFERTMQLLRHSILL